ncbi:MAG: MAPEG family protein [Paracoccaceae bacterium]|nr:MAPEG family protein [Paracoccaceae bacterium]
MSLPVTTLIAGLLGLLTLLLAARVILRRRSVGAAFGDGGDRELKRRIRALGNCAEYAPIGLILLGLLELRGTAGWWLWLWGGVLLVGRVIHGIAFSFAGAPMNLRVFGMVLTLIALGVLSASALGVALF